MLSQHLKEDLQRIIREDVNKKIEKIRKKISKWQQEKKRCPKVYDEELCISRYNNMIQDAKNKIKKLQGKPVKPIRVYGPYTK